MKHLSLLLFALAASGQDRCNEALNELRDPEKLQSFTQEKNVGGFVVAVITSQQGATLKQCWQITDAVWREILYIGLTSKSIKSKKDKEIADRFTAALLAVFAHNLGPTYAGKLKQFYRYKPWERGLPMSAQIAADELLKYGNVETRKTLDRGYTRPDLEAALAYTK